EPGSVFTCRPFGGEVRHNRGEAVLRDVLVVHDEVVEHPHHRDLGRICSLFEDRHAGRAVAVINLENTPGFLRDGRISAEPAAEEATKHGDPSNNEPHGAFASLWFFARGAARCRHRTPRPIRKKSSTTSAAAMAMLCSHSASGTKITPGLTAQAYSPGGGKRIRTVGPFRERVGLSGRNANASQATRRVSNASSMYRRLRVRICFPLVQRCL